MRQIQFGMLQRKNPMHRRDVPRKNRMRVKVEVPHRGQYGDPAIGRADQAPSKAFLAMRTGLGCMLVFLPGPIIRYYSEKVNDIRSRSVARLLGGRQLIQAALTARATPTALTIGIATDLMHAFTMIGLAVFDRSRRRAALADALTASTFAGAGALLLRRNNALHKRCRPSLVRTAAR